jgi:three-Cys-motif partner protein
VGSATGRKGSVKKAQNELFDIKEVEQKTPPNAFLFQGGRIPESGLAKPPSQTNSKSRLIAQYISQSQNIRSLFGSISRTRRAVQATSCSRLWGAAKPSIYSPPFVILWKCEIEKRGIKQLKELKKKHHHKPSSRRVAIMEGDFNETVKLILKSDRLTPRAAIFALLDQRNTECHWATVQALAARAGRTKIEILYFLGTSWLHRSLTQSRKAERIEEINKWWGNNDWKFLTELSQTEQVNVMAGRFLNELGYKHVTAYPIMQDELGKKKSFYLIHASDHSDAPKLMTRAYSQIVGDVEGTPSDTQGELFP